MDKELVSRRFHKLLSTRGEQAFIAFSQAVVLAENAYIIVEQGYHVFSES